MELSQKDFDEIAPLAGLIRKIDAINSAYANAISDEIYKKQPFFLSVLLG